jgi:hypothetical protein
MPAAGVPGSRAFSSRRRPFSSRSSAVSCAISRFASRAAASTSRSDASASSGSRATPAAQHSKHPQQPQITHHEPRVSASRRGRPRSRPTTRFPNTYSYLAIEAFKFNDKVSDADPAKRPDSALQSSACARVLGAWMAAWADARADRSGALPEPAPAIRQLLDAIRLRRRMQWGCRSSSL